MPASFPDVPEAPTEGATEREARARAEDCPTAALGGYVEGRRDVPRPSPGKGRPLVAPPALAAARIALYRAMRERGVGNAEPGGRLGWRRGPRRGGAPIEAEPQSPMSASTHSISALNTPSGPSL